MKRMVRTLLAALACVVVATSIAACAPASTTPSSTPTNQPVAPAKVRIGVLPTEDSVPLWIAERDGLFTKAGLSVEITVFQSAQERDAALTAGAIDAEMGDPIAAANLRSGGVPVKIVTIMLGADASQGRFGIAVKPKSKITSVAGLANVPVGTSAASIQEYVLDSLMADAGVPVSKIKTNIVPKVPVRFELLMSGKLEAAALPEPFLSLAAIQGAKVLADDTKKNISQTVMIFAQKYLDQPAGAAAVKKLLAVWDVAVETANGDPAGVRAILVDKARLPGPLKDSFVVSMYPKAQLPTQAEIDAVLAWMRTKGLLKTDVTYNDLVWTAPAN